MEDYFKMCFSLSHSKTGKKNKNVTKIGKGKGKGGGETQFEEIQCLTSLATAPRLVGW